MFRSLISTAALFLVAAPSAFAHDSWRSGDERAEGRYQARRVDGHEWRELNEAREHFYAQRHSRWEVRRFERWYAMRMEQLRRDRY